MNQTIAKLSISTFQKTKENEKNKPYSGRKYLQVIYLIKDLIARNDKELNMKKTNNPILKIAEI